MSQEAKNEAIAIPHSYDEDLGKGLEHSPPPQLASLRIVHSKSRGIGIPGKLLEKAKIGQLWLSDPFTLMDTVCVIPCNIQRLWMEWASSKVSGGPPIAAYSARPSQATWIDKEGLRMPSGTFVAETHTYYILVLVKKNEWHKATMNMSKTALPVSFEWLRLLQQKVRDPKSGELKMAPSFARRFNFDTKRESNAENSWDAWHMMDSGEWMNPNMPEFKLAKVFYGESNEIMQKMSIFDPRDLAKATQSDDIPF